MQIHRLNRLMPKEMVKDNSIKALEAVASEVEKKTEIAGNAESTDKEFFDSHKYGLLHRLGEKSKGIEFFALIKTVGNDMTVLRTAKIIEENPGLIDYIYENSKYSRKLDFTGEDNIVVLDTCDFTITDGRSILVGRLTDNIEENTFRKSSVKENPFQNLITKTSKVNILKILGIFWVILVIIYLIYESIRKKKEDEANVQ